MTAQPGTGTTWEAGGFNDVDSRLAERGGLQAVLIRDYRGADTNISPFDDDCTTVTWSPLAVDGTLRSDLFARTLVDGIWTTNASPNEGWFYIGAQTEKGGAERNPNTKSDDLMILQSPYPFDSDVITKTKTVKFTAVQTADPLIQRLEADLRLQDEDGVSLVPDMGGQDYGVGSKADIDTVERQLMLVYAKRKAGKFTYRIEGYPLVKFDAQARKTRSKTDPDTAELTYKVLPDPYFMIPDPDGEIELVPGIDYVWYGGDGWFDLAPAGS